MFRQVTLTLLSFFALLTPLSPLAAQETAADNQLSSANANANANQSFIGRSIAFDIAGSSFPEGVQVEEVLWDFGDGVRTTGEKVSHTYSTAGSYTVRVQVTTNQGRSEDTAEVTVYKHLIVLLADSSAPEAEITIAQQQAAKTGLLLLVLSARGVGPDAVTEEELANQLIDNRDAVSKANLILSWTAGSVGSSALSKFGQHVRQAAGLSLNDLKMADKGIILLSNTPFGVLTPTAQSTFDQLSPAYVLLTKPQALSLLLEPLAAEEAKQIILNSSLTHRLLGTFSARVVSDLGPTNFLSFGINYLVNHGVPINSITLILMLPIIATILAFSRQVIGIKAFGLITPALTTLSFLVMGLQYGLIIFSAVLLAGTLTRLTMRRLHLLYLPRMALVLTSVSLAILVFFGFGVATNNNALASFSIFPILILTLLAEEFIDLQFKSGARRAFIVTAWTILLAVACYFIVSWQLLRTVIVSYPEVILIAIPLNILFGRWGGLRLTEYFRFRKLLRYVQ